jgi:hypothetical protein
MGATLFEFNESTSNPLLGEVVLLHDYSDRSLSVVKDNVVVPIALDVEDYVPVNDKLLLRMMDGSVRQLRSADGELESCDRRVWPEGLTAIASDGTEVCWQYGEPATIRNAVHEVSWTLEGTWVACIRDGIFCLTDRPGKVRGFQEFDLRGNQRWSYTTSGDRSGRADHNMFPALVGTDYALLNGGVDEAGIGEVLCVSRSDGQIAWNKAVPGLCGVTALRDTCVVAAMDRFELWNARTGEKLDSHQLSGFGKTLAVLTEHQVVVVGERGGYYVAHRASPNAGAVACLPAKFVAAVESGTFGAPGSLTADCFGPQQFGYYRRQGLLIGSGLLPEAPELVSIPRLPWQRVKRADVEYHIQLGSMSRYEAMRSARVSVREAFYAVGRESSFNPQPTFDAEHGGLIILEYSGDDARVLADLERVAAEETVWADEMALRAGTRDSFVVTARKA